MKTPGTRFTLEVTPSLPPRLARLADLADDLWYAWDRPTRNLFARLDLDLWRAVGHSPKALLRQVDEQRLVAAADDPVLIVMPADHAIKDVDAFAGAVAAGLQHAAAGKVVTFGIVPDAPQTRFGYIRAGAEVDTHTFLLEAFVEKPDRATAESYLATGGYFWNSGIFLLRATRWLGLIARFRPDIAAAVRSA